LVLNAKLSHFNANEHPMKFGIQVLASIAIACLGVASAHAQAVLVEKNVSMKMAQMIIDGVIEDCAKTGYKVSVVIIDNAGIVRASLRGDGTSPHTMEFARKKRIHGPYP
jgi:hypothetical protein